MVIGAVEQGHFYRRVLQRMRHREPPEAAPNNHDLVPPGHWPLYSLHLSDAGRHGKWRGRVTFSDSLRQTAYLSPAGASALAGRGCIERTVYSRSFLSFSRSSK